MANAACNHGRRRFLNQVAQFAPAASLLFTSPLSIAAVSHPAQLTPSEFLMTGHGVIERTLLIYKEIARRIEDKEEVDPELLPELGNFMKRFFYQAHDDLEESVLFPVLENDPGLTSLVMILREQHAVGRNLASRIRDLGQRRHLKKTVKRQTLSKTIRSYALMYEAHTAYEDTLLLPALRRKLSAAEYLALTKPLVEKASVPLESAVQSLERFEKAFGIGSLAFYTPYPSAQAPRQKR